MKEMLAVFLKVAVELRPGTPDLSTISVPCQRRVPEGLDNTFMVISWMLMRIIPRVILILIVLIEY